MVGKKTRIDGIILDSICMSKYNDYTKEELIKHMETLEKQLKSNKFGLYWDKNIEKEEVLKQLGENVPMLIQNDELSISEDKDSNLSHLLIEGDNLHALSALEMLNNNSEGLVDVIYIDPPYNTGRQDFIYNDKFVDAEDGYKHSKWLNFMEPRLKLAKRLLVESGVILISIDDNEHAHLKILMDEIYGESNFVGNFIWSNNAGKNNSKTVKNNYEYIVCYAKNIEVVKQRDDIFRIQKPGFVDVNNILKDGIKVNKTPKEIEKDISDYYKKNRGLKGISSYKYVDDKFRIYTSSDMSDPSNKNRNDFELLHPVTKKPCTKPSGGWLYNEEKTNELILNDGILFGEDEKNVPRLKRFLDNVTTDVMSLIFEENRDGSRDMIDIFSDREAFDYPKPVNLMKYLLSGFNNKVAVLDFFAGSGTLGHAVLDLNKEDNGSRKFIMITNNEGNIMRGVTQPRINTVITGIRQDGSKYSDGIPSNVKFYETKLIEKTDDEISDRDKISEYMSDMISIKEDIQNKILKDNE